MVDRGSLGAKHLDSPKSAILISAVAVVSSISMFSSFRSRCTTPGPYPQRVQIANRTFVNYPGQSEPRWSPTKNETIQNDTRM